MNIDVNGTLVFGMISEIYSATLFLSSLLRPNLSNCTAIQLERFEKSLVDMLCAKFSSHWDENNPMKGNGFRSLMLSYGFIDPILQEAARQCSFEISAFSTELTIWIDPGEVTYRIGEHGSIATLEMAHEREYNNFIHAK